MASRSDWIYEATPPQVFEALRRAVLSAGYEIQGSDAGRGVLYFRGGGTNMSGLTVPETEGATRLVLNPSSADALHSQVAAELPNVLAETQVQQPAPVPSVGSGSLAADLESLADLRERGLLTEQEFARAKERALREVRVEPLPQQGAPSGTFATAPPQRVPSQARPVAPLPTPKRTGFGSVWWHWVLLAFAVLFVGGGTLLEYGGSRSPSSGGAGATEAEFSVTGSAPSGVDITYGNDTSNHQGSQPPFYATLPIQNGASYYALTAQLQGGGRITCKLTIGDAVVVGHASGGYNICSAQLNSDFSGGWGR